MRKIVQAAFRKKGQVIGTGNFHDVKKLPDDWDLEESEQGFITDTNEFLTREEAAKEVNADHDVQSQELIKMQPPAPFPNLGIANRPSPLPIVTTKQQLKNKTRAVTQFGGRMPEGANVSVGMTSIQPGLDTGFIRGNQLRAKTETGQSNLAPLATQLHEQSHQLFNKVQAKHGPKGRMNLAHNLFASIPLDARNALHHFVATKTKNQIEPTHWHEEHLAHLLNYLNDPAQRDAYHSKMGHTDEQRLEFNQKMKQAHRALQVASRIADKKWTKRIIRKSEQDLLFKQYEWQPTKYDLELASDMLHLFDEQSPEFVAASFMANHYKPTVEEIETALRDCEGDKIIAALTAHKIPINDENIDLLKKLLDLQDVSKSNIEIAAIPRVVKPFDDRAVEMAENIQLAFNEQSVKPVKLNGKHSKGAALVRIDNQIWFLKPGSGKLSTAAGIREESASQSRREVAFNIVGEIMGLGAYLPKAFLLLIDNVEVACLQFFAGDFKPAAKVKKEAGIEYLQQLFEGYNQNSLLSKWSVLDYLCGQVDRHASNLLINEGGVVKFIDAGSTFAGVNFDPNEPKSFVPFYLRVFGSRNFKVLTPDERYKAIPKLNSTADNALKWWIDSINDGAIVRLLNQYGIHPQPFMDRLQKLRQWKGSKSDFLARFWSGLKIDQNANLLDKVG